MAALDARLDNVMAEAEIAANAQRDVEQEAMEGEVVEDDEDLVDDDADDAAGDQPETSSEQRRYTRRDAERLAAELAQHRGATAARQAADERILNHLQHQSGYVREANGRFRYENLSEKVLKGTATPEEAEEVAVATSWQEFASPIYSAAQAQVESGFVNGWRASFESAVKAEKLGPEAFQRLWGSRDPIREAIKIGRELERGTQRGGAVRPSAATAHPQHQAPRSQSRAGAEIATGGAPAAAFLKAMMEPDFEARAKRGEFLGADLTKIRPRRS
jgi:hypothetical protein